MSGSRSFEIARKHVEALGSGATECALLRPDATLRFMDTGELFVGAREIMELFDNLHSRLFGASTQLRSYGTEDGSVVLEAQFNGHHIREFAGIRPTGTAVQSSYVLAYDIDDGAISSIRAYWNLDSLVRQLRGG